MQDSKFGCRLAARVIFDRATAGLKSCHVGSPSNNDRNLCTAANGGQCHLQTSCTAAKSVLVDQLIGCHKQRLWDGEAERFHGLEVDLEHIFHRRLHR